MLAYSAIAHSGFMLLGVLAGNVGGISSAVFYVCAYALMTVGGFGAIVLISVHGEEKAELTDIKGLAARNGFSGWGVAAAHVFYGGHSAGSRFCGKTGGVTGGGIGGINLAGGGGSVVFGGGGVLLFTRGQTDVF